VLGNSLVGLVGVELSWQRGLEGVGKTLSATAAGIGPFSPFIGAIAGGMSRYFRVEGAKKRTPPVPCVTVPLNLLETGGTDRAAFDFQ